MHTSVRIERALRRSLASLVEDGHPSPAKLSAAVREAVFSGGGRLRPRLTLAVSAACGERHPWVADGFAAAVELIHCASLVHDDLPCFDNAETRRGRPTVHKAFGEPLAVLAGDELIVLAFDVIGQTARRANMGAMVSILARAVRSPRGIIAGQAWESETVVSGPVYRRAKTASLFEAAACGGAAASELPHDAWRPFGMRIGDAYQIADDILDVVGTPWAIGKPVAQDATLGRPNVVRDHDLDTAFALLHESLSGAKSLIPPCETPEHVVAWVDDVQLRFDGLLRASEGIARAG